MTLRCMFIAVPVELQPSAYWSCVWRRLTSGWLLKLNSETSEVIWVGSKRTVTQHTRRASQIGTGSISASNSVRLLGVLICHLTDTSPWLLGSVLRLSVSHWMQTHSVRLLGVLICHLTDTSPWLLGSVLRLSVSHWDSQCASARCSDLSFDRHITMVARQCFTSVRQSLDADFAATLIRAFVSSRLDYCNSSAHGEQ